MCLGSPVMPRLLLSACVLYAVLVGQRSEAAPRQKEVGRLTHVRYSSCCSERAAPPL